MLSAMVYVLRTGVPWRDLPRDYGPWSSVYTRFRRWNRQGLFAQLLHPLWRRPPANCGTWTARTSSCTSMAPIPRAGNELKRWGAARAA